MITAITLADDDRGLSSVIKDRSGVAFQGLDVAGAVREVIEPLPGQDGSWDQTQYADTAAVTLNLRLYGTGLRAVLDELAQYCAPWSRPYLQVADDEWSGDRLLRLRYDSAHAPIVLGSGATRAVTLSWKVASGGWEAATQTEYWINASAAGTSGVPLTASAGLSLTAAAGLSVPAGATSADTLVNVGGSGLRPTWIARLYGPCSGPALYADDTGEAIIFDPSLSLAAGEYIELNSADRTANFNSAADSSRLLYLDYANSSWFKLEPGTRLIRYAPSSVSAGSQCYLAFASRWMP